MWVSSVIAMFILGGAVPLSYADIPGPYMVGPHPLHHSIFDMISWSHGI